MALKLKQFRVRAGLTQVALAKAIGVSQPNYQRWESGASSIPEDKLRKLAEVLQVGTAALLGRHPPISAGFYDRSAGEDLNYYGEVAIHFCGGGKPLLLSITDGAFSRLHHDLQRSPAFVTVESLANQTVAIRTRAIADLYFSSEAYDDYGPEHDDYEDHVLLQLPDARDWEIIEALSGDDEWGLESFSTEDVLRVSRAVMITEQQYKELVAAGVIELGDLEGEKERNQLQTGKIFDLATKVRYQLSSGKQRSVDYMDVEDLYEAFYSLVELDGDVTDDFLLVRVEGSHRIAFINKEALDYVMLPTHRFAQGGVEMGAKMLDEPV
jgi:transcriptional regulator with XRE-family HTH domain